MEGTAGGFPGRHQLLISKWTRSNEEDVENDEFWSGYNNRSSCPSKLRLGCKPNESEVRVTQSRAATSPALGWGPLWGAVILPATPS